MGFLAFALGVLLSATGAQAAEISHAPAFKATDLMALPRGNWVTNGGTVYNQRFSPLTEINTENVSRLKAMWRTHLDGSGLGPQYSGEAQPLVYDGVIYIITGADDVFAVSVKTGGILWKYEAHLDPNISTVCCGWTSRGVALGDGLVYVGQLDGKIVALDQKTGKVKWSVQAEKWQDGYTITSAPLYYEGLVISGFAGGDRDNDPNEWRAGKSFIGASGFKTVEFPTFGILSAIDLKTNTLVWQQRWVDQCYSGSAVTAGGVLFVGRSDGRMSAFNSADGKKLWEFQTGAGVNAPPAVFEYEGRQYVAVLSAGNLFGRSARGDSLWLFALDAPMGPVAAARPGGAPAASGDHTQPPVALSPAERSAARREYDRTCAGCHGLEGEGTANGMALINSKDGAKNAAAIQQGRGSMPPFGDLIAHAEIGWLASYVTTLPLR